MNDKIIAEQVRLIDVSGNQVGVIPLQEAQGYAEEAGLDLVEIVPDAAPPVCRVMDYGKYLFDRNKKRQESRRRQKQVQVKEVRFRPRTDEGDYQVKLKNLLLFLGNGDRAKVTLRFRGREMQHQDLGLKMLQRVEEDLRNHAVVEQVPTLEGRQMVMLLTPKK